MQSSHRRTAAAMVRDIVFKIILTSVIHGRGNRHSSPLRSFKPFICHCAESESAFPLRGGQIVMWRRAFGEVAYGSFEQSVGHSPLQFYHKNVSIIYGSTELKGIKKGFLIYGFKARDKAMCCEMCLCAEGVFRFCGSVLSPTSLGSA